MLKTRKTRKTNQNYIFKNMLKNYIPQNNSNIPICLFFQLLSYSRIASESDLQVLIMGKEGSGKSGLSMILGATIDEHFLDNLKSKFYLSGGSEVIRFFEYIQTQNKLGNKKIVYLIDEAHTWMHSQDASTKESIRLKQYYRNARISGAIGLHCTPNMTEIQPLIIQRSDVIILLGKLDVNKNLGTGYIFLGEDKFNLATKLKSLRSTGQYISNDPEELMKQCNSNATFTFKWSQEPKLYNLYRPLKNAGYSNFLDDAIAELSNKHNLTQISNDYYGLEINPGGYKTTYDEKPPVLFENDYMSYNVIVELTGIDYKALSQKVARLRKQNKISTVKIGLKQYVRIGDINKLL
ncbi:hypothetical protein J2127_001083 [Methanococcus voltae]|uniref:hypothetical protein n=1 Tax=Methanococcus voltae TaxID=2188 RepID=UPI001AE5C228|nr:hypothetical protein [Methanococcus voltae]MBP2143914.1 hypothetical protein [Methanococcus voltae]